MNKQRLHLILLMLGLAMAAGPLLSSATPISESGDAGETTGTAQDASGASSISGSLNGDADLFRILISDPAAFSATTDTPGTSVDTQLFLFDASGLGIYANDDKGGCSLSITQFCSLLPAADPNSPTLSGIYYLGISGWNNDPVSAGGLIFADQWTGVSGPTGPGGGLALSGWGSGASGDYVIALTGISTAVPEPGTLALLGLGLAGMGFARRRSRSRR